VEIEIIRGMPDRTPPALTASIDLEIYGMEKSKLHRPNQGTFASLQICLGGEKAYVIEDVKDVPKAMDNIKMCTHVFHNSVFDIRHLRRWCNYPDNDKMIDTMLIERILWGGYYDSFSLKDLSRRYLDELVDKAEREEFATAETMTPAMIAYAGRDAVLTWHIWQKQKELLTADLSMVWEMIDRPALYAILNLKGFKMDTKKWTTIANKHKKIADEIESTLNFNPRSPTQTLAALRASGLRKVSATNEKELTPYKEYPLVKQILEMREHAKAASTYGLDFIKKHVEDEYIYPEINVTQAETGRMSSTSPNIQNIPNSPEYRGCFVASEGDVLIVADYSAQEPRITAFESKDPAYLEVVKSGDIHTEVGRRLFGKNIKKNDPLRKQAKALNLGLTYGLTPRGLMNNINGKATCEAEKITLATAESLVNTYFKEFSGIRQWIELQRNIARRQGYTTTNFGRKIFVNPFSYSWLNNAINSPIQGGAADIIKRAVARLYYECGEAKIEFPVVAIVHDEIVCDVPEGIQDSFKSLMETCMIEEAELLYPNMPFLVETHIGKTWACKE
jgi:DNA polymerase-1